ncbi:MAG: SDR family oxidoreductase [Candidatus Woesebacteria bacterium]|jgi:UDP-glucuronate decarboxylase
MDKPTILIAGGAGFLGSHLCDAYTAKDYNVIAVDNLCTGAHQNIEHLVGNPNFTFVKHDICQPLPQEVTSKDIKIVANLASPASPPHYQRLSMETLNVGSIGVQNLLELTRQKNARFMQASTSEVYGDPEVHPQPESYRGCVNSYGPRSMYDESKRFAEAMIYSYKTKYNLNTGIIRIFNTYGPRMDKDDGRVVSNFVVQALQNKPLTVYGKGDQTRSFCYVSDLIAGMVAMMDSSEEGPINLGNPDEFTIIELANIINDLVGNKSEIIYKPLPGDDPTQRKPIIDRAKTKLNWQPSVKLKDGLKPTIEYFAKEISK